MAHILNLYLVAISATILAVFQRIIPELPILGLAVSGLTFLLFLFYLFKQGLPHALKISSITFGVLSFVLFAIHTMMRIAGVSPY